MNFKQRKIAPQRKKTTSNFAVNSDSKRKNIKKITRVNPVISRKKRVFKKRKKIIKNNKLLSKIIIYSIIGLFFLGIIGVSVIYIKYIKPLPPITKLETLDIPEASIIYDKDGGELYTMYSGEKRRYVNYDKISKNMINAIVSIEDKTFFQNRGVDFKGILRSVFNYVTHKTSRIEGTSTISQQLIKNVFLNNERKLERKVKEVYLSYSMNNNYSKEKILELYLNKISFGSNAYGVEEAAKTFFDKSAKDINILESTILASIPKGPTYYSPYSHYDRLLGYPYIYNSDSPTDIKKLINKTELDSQKAFIAKFKEIIKNIKGKRISNNKILICGIDKPFYKKDINIDNDKCKILEYSEIVPFLNNIQIKGEQLSEKLKGKIFEYQTGRKDLVLARMLEDDKITLDEFKESFLNSIGFEFKKYIEKIKYPYFVFYVKEYLENKYGKEFVTKGGLKIYTSIDPKLQDKAEEIVEKQALENKKKFGANSAGLISIDNETGQILSMVGGKDFFDRENDGNVNIITSKRQPGSTFKPFVYALAIKENKIGTETPIYDLKTTFPGDYSPANYDGKFQGKISIMKALNHSRNIPAIKMFFLAGKQEKIIDFMELLGVKSLKKSFIYGSPLGIGTGEIKAIELAQAYSVFANMGYKKELVPVIKILDSKGVEVEKIANNAGDKVMSSELAYIMNYILSATYSRDAFWNNYLSLKDRQAAAKTGTSNKQFIENGKKKILPGDMWTAGYTKQITTVAWSGNKNGKPLNARGNGLEGAGPIWKQFMEFAHIGKEAKIWQKPETVSEAKISTLSGKLADEDAPEEFTKLAYFMPGNTPSEIDNSMQEVEIDLLCNGKVTPETPLAAIKKGYYVGLHSIDKYNTEWEDPVKDWIKEGGTKELFSTEKNIITKYSDEKCVRYKNLIDNANITIKSDINEGEFLSYGLNNISLNYTSNNPIKQIDIYLDNTKIKEIPLNGEKSGIYKGSINIPQTMYGKRVIKIMGIDNIYYSGEENKKVSVIKRDITPSIIEVTNPIDGDIGIYSDQEFNLRFNIKDRSEIRTTNIYLDDKYLQIGLKGEKIVSLINEKHNIPVGIHTIKIETIDLGFNKSYKKINLEVLAR